LIAFETILLKAYPGFERLFAGSGTPVQSDSRNPPFDGWNPTVKPYD
jgi:hypothetical protein